MIKFATQLVLKGSTTLLECVLPALFIANLVLALQITARAARA